LGSRNFGEAGRHYFIFTRDLGMVTASAEGVRKISSKLRYVLQDFAYLKIDLVSGRNIFRVTNASKSGALEQITKNPETFKEDLPNIEAIIVLRILNNLGYIGENYTLENLIKSPFEENLVFAISKDRAKVLRKINQALKETHL